MARAELYCNLVHSFVVAPWSTSSTHGQCRYNIGIIAPIYVNPGFIKALHKPTAAQKGLITAIYYLGTWTSYVFLSGMVSDRLGRRYAALTGTALTCIGGAVQVGSHGKSALAMMVIGRIISGFGNAIISTSVPLYQRSVVFLYLIWELRIDVSIVRLLQPRGEVGLL